jgi:diaminohydroxyphosphoribosylaminopyrimidine deaminase/5-amino-6-(5-phosphoribosylamino)uracil reductase
MTGPAANRQVHRERAEVDAIAVGSGTVLVDDPWLTVRGVYRHRPLTRVVFDRRLRTPPSVRLLSTVSSGPVIIVTEAASVERQADRARELIAAGAVIEAVGPDGARGVSFLAEALRRLAQAGINSLIVEGGPTLHAAFWRARLVDRVEIFLAPTFLRPAGVPWNVTDVGTVAALRETAVGFAGEDVRIEGYVHRTD